MFRILRAMPFISFFAITLIPFLGYCVWAANQADYDIQWTREVPSAHTPEELGRALENLELWPVFHHSLRSAQIVDENAKPETKPLAPNESIRYEIVPPKKEWKRFEMTGQVLAHEKEKSLSVRLTDDSTGRLTKLFNQYQWKVEVVPANEFLQKRGFKSLVRGEAVGHTANWRGRVFGKISPKILMNQVFYVDLVKLSTLDKQIEAQKENLAPSYQ